MKSSRPTSYRTSSAAQPAARRPYPAQPSSQAVYRRVPRPRRRSGPSLGLLLFLGACLVGLLLLPFAAAFGVYAYFQVFERILPGVQVGEMSLSGRTVEQAAVELHKTWNMERSIQVSDGIHILQVLPAELGLSVDAWGTASTAYQVGHNQPILAEMDQMLAALESGWELAPQVNYDPAAARRGLEALSTQVSQAPKDASLRLEGRTLVAVPGELGYTINIEETLGRLATDPRLVLLSGSLQIALQPVTPHINDVSAAMAEAQRLLDTSPNLRAYDAITNEWLDLTVPPEVVASWLKIETGEQGPQVSIDPQPVADYLAGLGDTLGQDRLIDPVLHSGPLAEAVRSGAPYTLLFNHKPTTYIVQPGDTLLKIGWKLGFPFWMLLRANPDLDPEALWTGQEIVVPSKDELLPLPVVPNKRIVISIGEQHLWAYQDGSLVSEHVISTGIDRSPTQPGIFQVQTHELSAYASVWDLTMPNFLGIYEAWPGFMNGIHGLPTLSNGRRLWGSILGRPASYGCIILDLNAAEWLFNWAENGVVVEIIE